VPPPLEYSPFNYTFSKTSGWYPGDLAVRENSAASAGPNGNGAQMGAGFGPSNLIASLSQGGSTSALNASRAMNFASVAASGISSSMSTTTAQISTATMNGAVGGLVSIGGPKVSDGRDQEGEPKAADASKAPGYRGNTMGSPVMRMQQQQQQQNVQQQQSFGGLDGGFGVPGGMNLMGGYGNAGSRQQQQQQQPAYGIPGQFQPQEMAPSGLLNHQQGGMNDGNHMMYQNNRSDNVLLRVLDLKF
jgi:hypothetical protein